MGAALMSVLLTNQFNRSENIAAANTVATLQRQAAETGLQVDETAIPQLTLGPDFVAALQRDLSVAYTTVFVVAVVLVALTFIPAAFLPKKPTGRSANELARPTA